MSIQIRGAREHNLKQVNVDIGPGLTAVTGVSGSGKSSLVFDTLYHEARRRFLEIYSVGSAVRLAPAEVDEILGLGPAVAVGQNLLNRNPLSTVATASGLHPFLRLLYTHYGARACLRCGAPLACLSSAEMRARLEALAQAGPLSVFAVLAVHAPGSHRTLLAALSTAYLAPALWVDGEPYTGAALDPQQGHRIELRLDPPVNSLGEPDFGRLLERAWAMGACGVGVRVIDPGVETPGNGVETPGNGVETPGNGAEALAGHDADGSRRLRDYPTTRLPDFFSRIPVCPHCGLAFDELRPLHFHQCCPACEGAGCAQCVGTGQHPAAAAMAWQGRRLPELLALPVEEALGVLDASSVPPGAGRLWNEILARLRALEQVGLGYLGLDRPVPTLSRGEAQRLRLALALQGRLEDVLHILDEPTVGLHPADVARLLAAFHQLRGPLVFVEHDRAAVALADRVIDLGPGAGQNGGEVIFTGAPQGLWQADTPSGRYFSLRQRAQPPAARPAPGEFLTVRAAHLRNLQSIAAISFPLGRITAVTGVSGSGKSTLVEDVLAASLEAGAPVGCRALDGPPLKVVLVDQSPIGRNPRSNPATYTKLADLVRDVFAARSGLSASHFSFNRPQGACPQCEGLGAQEVTMRYLPSTWITCPDCQGKRFSEEVLARPICLGGRELNIAAFYELSIAEALKLIGSDDELPAAQQSAVRILQALVDIGLGYLPVGQPSPTLSGGEAQRVKLARYLGQKSLARQLLILDEPSTGLHPADLAGLLAVLDRLARHGATVVVVEHNLDVISQADWVIDLGPGSGPRGGRLLYAGPPDGLAAAPGSLTGAALRAESELVPSPGPAAARGEANRPGVQDAAPGDAPADAPAAAPPPLAPAPPAASPASLAQIVIRGARLHNLKNVTVAFPKGRWTVVTGVSGSGKSSLVSDILESEARRRFLETLSLYERQAVHEGAEVEVDAIEGLGVTLAITPERVAYARRATVGTATELSPALAVLLATVGEGPPGLPLPAARYFSPVTYAAVCLRCNGVGALIEPRPEKLLARPEQPLLGGAMYSPGFFPNGFLGKPFNSGFYLLQALGRAYGFDPFQTPWNEMSYAAQQAFLFGTQEELPVEAETRSAGQRSYRARFPGFYGFIRDWDVGGAYSASVTCPDCGGARLRPQYLAVTLGGFNIHQLSRMPLVELEQVLARVARRLQQATSEAAALVQPACAAALRRLNFLGRVGLGYLHLDRVAGTLSAGELQRIRLAGMLGSGLGGLTLLLDEPSRGLHPAEVAALIEALADLRRQGNTVICIEHDPQLITAADYLIDIGPGAGQAGGQVLYAGPPGADGLPAAPALPGAGVSGAASLPGAGGPPAALALPGAPGVSHAGGLPDASGGLSGAAFDTPTGLWLRGRRRLEIRTRRRPAAWLEIKGARENNLQNLDVRLPLGVLAGVCGLSGSGKSTLVIDTLGRALAPRKQTTSVAYEPVEPGEHDAILGAPARVLVVDQSRAGLTSPASFLGIAPLLSELYAASEPALALGIGPAQLERSCSTCKGNGFTRLDMEFLPDVRLPCETCRGTGFLPEAWQVRLHGVALPEAFGLSIEEALRLFGDERRLQAALQAAIDVGLGYLALRQPGHALSGGEAQRLKIAAELARRRAPGCLYILDEPTVGQHLEDVARLAGVLHRLVDEGASVLVVEHHTHLLASCDWLVELGPAGGPHGGQVIASGPPESLAAGNTSIAPYLRAVLG